MKKRRVFIAVSVPPDMQKKLLAAVEEWRAQDLPIRWTRQEHVHVTLLFIGNVDDEELARIAATLPRAVEGVESFDISLDSIAVGPNGKNPRMVWAEGEGVGELMRLQRQVQDAVFEQGRTYAGDDEADEASPGAAEQKRPFRLHVTLGRMLPFLWKKLGASAPHIEKSITLSFPVTSIELMESELTPKGPVYTPLSSVALG